MEAAFPAGLVGVGHGHGQLEHVTNGQTGAELRILRHVRGPGALANRHFARVGFLLACQEGEQG